MGGAQWVGRSCVTSAHFGPCVCSGLWLLATDHDNSGSLGATLKSGHDTATFRISGNGLTTYILKLKIDPNLVVFSFCCKPLCSVYE